LIVYTGIIYKELKRTFFSFKFLNLQCRVSGNRSLPKTPFPPKPQTLWEERATIPRLLLIQTLTTRSQPDQPHSTPYQTRTEWNVFKWVN